MLRPLHGIFPTENYPDLLVGLGSPDDSAVYQIDAEKAIISTMDFFPPVVDDAYDFGAIAAANALSDIYAMGGEPLMAINLVAYPDGYGMDLLAEILRGGAEKVLEAGAVIAGGHTVTDKEPKYGLAVTGIVHPQKILTKSGAQSGDVLILTKPLGTGVITTALKNQQAEAAHVRASVESMKRLNRDASRLAQQYEVHALTDITGYGLLGHGHEMAHLSSVDLHIDFAALKWLDGAAEYATREFFAGGMYRNADYFGQWVTFTPSLAEWQRGLLYDPQTSGGLLMAVAPDHAEPLLNALTGGSDNAALIGTAAAGGGRVIVT